MDSARRAIGIPETLILIGSGLFIAALALSAYWEPDIRWLHFFQSWMYLAAIALSLRRNRWGYFIGISAAGLWDYLTVFANTFLRNGLHWLFAWFSTGQLQRADQIIAVPAWIGNFLVLAGCVWAYVRQTEKRRSDAAAMALAFIATTGFFAAAIATCQPRYLPMFRAMLHPRWP